jgi:hypothetical protein
MRTVSSSICCGSDVTDSYQQLHCCSTVVCYSAAAVAVVLLHRGVPQGVTAIAVILLTLTQFKLYMCYNAIETAFRGPSVAALCSGVVLSLYTQLYVHTEVSVLLTPPSLTFSVSAVCCCAKARSPDSCAAAAFHCIATAAAAVHRCSWLLSAVAAVAV